MMRANKEKILFLILESDSKCSESIYFDLLKENDEIKNNLNFDIVYVKVGPNLSKNKILRINPVKNINIIVLVKDNDVNGYTFQKMSNDIKSIKKIIDEYINDKSENDNHEIKIERLGIPNKDKTFDSFLLAHFDNKTFEKTLKEKNKIIKKLEKKLLGENYKGDKEKIKKVFVKNYKKNLFDNLKNFDEHYYNLAKLLFKND